MSLKNLKIINKQKKKVNGKKLNKMLRKNMKNLRTSKNQTRILKKISIKQSKIKKLQKNI